MEALEGFGVKDNNVDTFASGIVYSRGNDGGNINGGTGGGGGGVGAAANSNVGGDGLSGIPEINYDFLQNFGSSVGEYFSNENKEYFAGGGGGGTTASITGKGGDGIGGNQGGGVVAPSGLPNTGGGGGGGGGGSGTGGNGGSGIVIIRYLTPAKSSVIELINGTTPDANTDYRIGNYDGVFKVKKSVKYTEIDVLSINQTTAQMLVPDGIRSVAALICYNGISVTGNISTSVGNISTAYGDISTAYGSISASGGITANGSISTTYGNISTTYGNISTPTLNTINPSDWLRKSE
jgi:hypothetical protein